MPATPRVELVPHQLSSHQPLEVEAIPALAAISEPQSPVEPWQQQQPIEPASSSTPASAPPILGRLETSTRLLADFFQGEVIESSQSDAVDNSGETE